MRLITLMALMACSTGPEKPEKPEEFSLGGYGLKPLLVEAGMQVPGEKITKEPTSEWMRPDSIELVNIESVGPSVQIKYSNCPDGLQTYLEEEMVFSQEGTGFRRYSPGQLSVSNTWSVYLRHDNSEWCTVEVQVASP